MYPRNQLLIALTIAAAALLAVRVEAQTAYALANDDAGNSSLIRFDISNPGASTTVGPISGDFTALKGLDFRASNGLLYGYSFPTDGIALIDINTGATTSVATASILFGSEIGIDFNPQVDRLRLVNSVGANRRITVQTGLTDTDADLTLDGDTPLVVEAAYTNNDNDPGTPTKLYYIDFDTDSLLTAADPNSGILTSVGPLGVDTNRYTGFDIVTYGGINYGYAILTDPDSQQGFYSINLDNGEATLIGLLNADTVNVWGLSITPVPEPGTLTLIGTATVSLLAYQRRRVRAA